MSDLLVLLPGQFKKTGATSGGEYSGPCPFCGGQDRFQVWPAHEKGEGGRYWCRQCDEKGDAIDYLRKAESLTYIEACFRLGVKPKGNGNGGHKDRGAEIQPAFGKKEFRKPSQGLAKKYHEVLLAEPTAQAYLERRKINRESADKFQLGLYQDDSGRWLTIPHFQDGELVNVKFRNLNTECRKEDRFKRMTGCASILFNGDTIKGAAEVFVCEGELDAVTLMQHTGLEAVVSGTTGAGSFEPEWIDQLKKTKKIFICYDQDDAGRQGGRGLAKRLGYERCFNVVFPADQDVNDFFQTRIAKDFLDLLTRARAFDLPGVVSMDAALELLVRERETGRDEIGLQTPWPSVNGLVRGFHPGDLIIVSALPKTGKTTWCLEITRGLMRSGQAALFYCLEMRPEKLTRKIIEAEYRIENPNLEAIERARTELAGWPLYFAHAFKKQKLEDVLNLIRDAIKRYDLKLVVFDNLHFLIRGINNVNEELGQAVQGFKLLAEEMEIPVICVAQPRKRETGSKEIMTAEDIKYSNAVHADCDMMIIMHRNRVATKAKDFNAEGWRPLAEAQDPETMIRVEAHRLGSGGETMLYFYGEQSRFEENDRRG